MTSAEGVEVVPAFPGSAERVMEREGDAAPLEGGREGSGLSIGGGGRITASDRLKEGVVLGDTKPTGE